jgi:hypothetical protein
LAIEDLSLVCETFTSFTCAVSLLPAVISSYTDGADEGAVTGESVAAMAEEIGPVGKDREGASWLVEDLRGSGTHVPVRVRRMGSKVRKWGCMVKF